MATPPKVQVDTMTADTYFAYAAELLKANPPHITDQPIIAQLKKIGFEPGQSFDLSRAPPEVQEGFKLAPAKALQLMAWKVPTLARVANGWSMNTDTMGVYGNYYLKRAIVAQQGLGANLPEDAIYPLNLADSTGKPLDGENSYVLHFEKDQIPPVNAFWSVTSVADLPASSLCRRPNTLCTDWRPRSSRLPRCDSCLSMRCCRRACH